MIATKAGVEHVGLVASTKSRQKESLDLFSASATTFYRPFSLCALNRISLGIED